MDLNFGQLGHFGMYHICRPCSPLTRIVEASLSHPRLLKRCAVCPPEPPPCPVCASNEVCSLFGGGCETCPTTRCEPVNGSSRSSGGGSNPAGPIAGGVIGGIVVICILTYLVWRFCIRKRRQEYDEKVWRASDYETAGGDFQSARSRASMHSVRSIASTVLTRASNVIQIAYIPGVTNRSVDSTPDLIPPVPPVPALSSSSGTPRTTQDEHFFLPSDLRNSTYSDYTVDRTSYARSSMTPSLARGSVPSTAYRGSAIVNAVPAQTAIRGKANPVAVRNNGKNSPTDSSGSGTPPVPAINRAKQDLIRTNTTSPIIARLGVPKAVTVSKSTGNLASAAASQPAVSPISTTHSEDFRSDRKKSTTDNQHNGRNSAFDDSPSSDEDSPADSSLLGHDKLPRYINPEGSQNLASAPCPRLSFTPSPLLNSSSDRARKERHKRSGSLNQIIEEAARKASKDPRHGGLGSVSSITENPERLRRSPEGPFGDEHAAKTP